MEYEKIIYGPGKSFSYRTIRDKYFSMPLHLHPEIEIMLVTEGRGKRFVGESVDEFYPGDLVIIGDGLPHFHLCDRVYYEKNDLQCEVKVIQFKRDIFPAEMEKIEDFSNISDLIKRSMYGVKFTNPPSIEGIGRMMESLDKLSGIKRINALMRMLDLLGRMKEYRIIADFDYNYKSAGTRPGNTAARVYDYLVRNFKNEVTLGAIAANLNQNPASLCRYFKRHTQKSIFDCLNEIRIGYARKLLSNSDFTVSQIAYESGYRNLSNFNKQFRKLVHASPTEYRAALLEQ